MRLLGGEQEGIAQKMIVGKMPGQHKLDYAPWTHKAVKERAEIHWGGTGVRNNCRHGRSYAPKGRAPTKRHMAKRFSPNMVSTVTNQGKARFMVYPGNMGPERLILFLRQLATGPPHKTFLILDNLRVHHSKPVKDWLADNKGKIEAFFLLAGEEPGRVPRL